MKTASFSHRIVALLLMASILPLARNQASAAINPLKVLVKTATALPNINDAPSWRIENNRNGVQIDWRNPSTDDSDAAKWASHDRNGLRLPVRLVTVRVAHQQIVQPRIVAFDSHVYAGDLPLAPVTVPRGADGQPLLDRDVDAGDLTLPEAPAFVLRDIQMGEVRWVVIAISRLFQRDGVPHALSQVTVHIDNGTLALSDSNAALSDEVDGFLALGEGLTQPNSTLLGGKPRFGRSTGPDDNVACANTVPLPSNEQARGAAWKINVSKAGLQSLTGADLQAAGLNTSATEADKLRLFRNGAEVAIELRDGNGNNRLDSGEELVFYAGAIGDIWNANDIYWLAADTVAGSRMSNGTNAIGSGIQTANTALENGMWRQAKEYDSVLAGTSGDHWFSKDMKTDTNSKSPEASYAITMSNVLPPASGNMSMTVHTTGYTRFEHIISVKLGSTTSNTQNRTGLGNWSPSFQINSTANNLVVYLNRAAHPSGSWLDKVMWQRPVSLDFRNAGGIFVVPAGVKRYQLSNTSATRTLYDVTDASQPKTVTLSNGSNTEFQSNNNGGTYILSGANTLFKPTVTAYAYSNLVQSRVANAIYIAPASLQSALAPLIAHRQSQGYSVHVVDPQLIYDWFSFGKVSPESIRSFLRFINANWPLAPLSVVLVGDGTNDPLNYTKKNVPNIIPPYLAEVDKFINETACDTCYVRFSCDSVKTDVLPDAYIGRFPVNTTQQLSTLVTKIIAYETSTDNSGWRNSIAFFSDNTDEAGSFEMSNDRLLQLQPATAAIKRMYYFEQSDISPQKPAANKTWYEYDAVVANQKIIKIINDGNSIINYNGHGNWKVWSSPTELDIADVDKLKNNGRPAILLEWTCLAGQFQNPVDGTAVMDEKFLLHPTGGAVAVWAPTGWDVIEAHEKMGIGFYRKLWSAPSGSQTMGALTMAGHQLLSVNSCCTEPIWTYTVLGDPLTKVRANSGLAPQRPSLPAPFADNSGNGSGGSAAFNSPSGLAISADKTFVLVADTQNHIIRRIDVATGAITILAGSAGISGATDGTSSAARFNQPSSIVISTDGKFALVADTGNHAIRRINLETGEVTTLAGQLTQSGSADGGLADARFFKPKGVAISGDGLFALVADSGNHTIRRLNLVTGEVSTVAGTAGIAASGNGIGASAMFNNPTAIAISGDGSIALVADTDNHTIRRINLLTREVKTVAGLAGSAGSVDGIVPTSRLNGPQGLWLSPDGQYALVTDTGNNTIRRLWLADNRLETILGKAGQTGSVDATGTGARFNQPSSIIMSLDGSLILVADSGNNAIRRLTGATKIYVSTLFKLKR